MTLPDRSIFEGPQILGGGRQSGKTTRLLNWVAAGEKIDRYPGWSRVLVVHSIDEVLRLRSIIRMDPEHPLFEDDPHRVYSLEEWRSAHNVAHDVEVAIDNLDLHVAHLIGHHGRVAKVSMSGEVEQ